MKYTKVIVIAILSIAAVSAQAGINCSSLATFTAIVEKQTRLLEYDQKRLTGTLATIAKYGPTKGYYPDIDQMRVDTTQLELDSSKRLVAEYTTACEQEKQQEAAAQAEAERRAKLPGVRIGMTMKQVREKTSWGEPESINRTITQYGTREQWVYGGRNYLYFTNGKLTGIQN